MFGRASCTFHDEVRLDAVLHQELARAAGGDEVEAELDQLAREVHDDAGACRCR